MIKEVAPLTVPTKPKVKKKKNSLSMEDLEEEYSDLLEYDKGGTSYKFFLFLVIANVLIFILMKLL